MIASLRGKIADKQAGKVVVDVGGVGYEVAVPVETYSQLRDLGEEVSLHVHTHMREGAISLYGFHSLRDLGLFERFIDVSGVGPRLALTLLSGMPASELLAAIRAGDSKKLVRIPGVGKKTGERIVLELKDRLGSFASDEDGTDAGTGAVEEDVISVLISLGCSADSANKAVRKARQNGAPAEFETLFRQAMELVKR